MGAFEAGEEEGWVVSRTTWVTPLALVTRLAAAVGGGSGSAMPAEAPAKNCGDSGIGSGDMPNSRCTE